MFFLYYLDIIFFYKVCLMCKTIDVNDVIAYMYRVEENF